MVGLFHTTNFGCTLHHMPQGTRRGLRWNSPEIAKIMARKHIATREELARVIGEPPTTVRRAFNEEWEGEATGPMIAAISLKLKVSVHRLLADPRE